MQGLANHNGGGNAIQCLYILYPMCQACTISSIPSGLAQHSAYTGHYTVRSANQWGRAWECKWFLYGHKTPRPLLRCFFFYQRGQFQTCQVPLRAKFRAISTDFGCARGSIRAAAHGWAPMVSCRCWCCHVSGISHSFGSQCVFCRFFSGCSGTSHKVGSHCSRIRFLAK